jgi:hypothetical protein
LTVPPIKYRSGFYDCPDWLSLEGTQFLNL